MKRPRYLAVYSFVFAVTAYGGAKVEGAAVSDYGGFTEVVLDLSSTTTFTAEVFPDKSSLVITVDAKLKKAEPPAAAGLLEEISFYKDRDKTVVTLIYGGEVSNYEGYVRKDPPAVVIKLVRRVKPEPKTLWRSAGLLAGKRVLLVDDDDGPGNGNKFGVDVDGYYTKALDRIGVEYDVATVSAGGSGPGAAKMSEYPLVIWFNGLDACPVVLSAADMSTVEEYVSAGGNLMLISQNFLSDNSAPTGAFRSRVLGLDGYKADTQASSVIGTVDGFYGEYRCDLGGPVRPIGNWGDGMKPGGATAILEGADGYAYAVANEVGEGRITFFSVAVENAGTTTGIADILDPALSWLAEQ